MTPPSTAALTEMTSAHADEAEGVAQNGRDIRDAMRAVDPSDDSNDSHAKLTTEIAAVISALASREMVMVNPKTHVVVQRKAMRERMSKMAGPSGGMELKRIEDAYEDMNSWLTASEESRG